MVHYFAKATGLTFRTLPFILLRLGVYLGFAIAFTVYLILVFFIGQAAASLHDVARIVVWIVAMVLPFPVWRLVRAYLIYVLKAGHVAVLAELIRNGDLPEGQGQIEWAKQRVQSRFKETSVLFLVDSLVTGVIRTINSMMQRLGNIFSGIPGTQSIVKIGTVILRFSLTYVDESILARNFYTGEPSVWESAKSGLVLYAQSWKSVLKTALFLGVVAMLSYAVLLVLMLIPFLALGKFFPALKWVFVIAAFVFAWVLKLALLDPWAMANMVLVYLKETENMVPNREWEDKLAAVSSKFQQIKQKALAEVSAATQPAPIPTPQAPPT